MSPEDRVNLTRLDLSTVELYTRGNPHQTWHTLRNEHPVFWNRLPDGGGFWSATRYQDVRRVLSDHVAFTSERGTAIDLVGIPDPAAGRMMHATDPPRHRQLRRPLERPLSAQRVPGYAKLVRALVQQALPRVPDRGSWDVARALNRLPASVMARLMGLPDADVDLLLQAAYASVAPVDARYRVGPVFQTLQWSHSTIVDYFRRWVRQRRESPGTDLLSYIATLPVGGRLLTQEEAVLNCYSVLVGGVVTTAQAAIAPILALADDASRTGRWPSTVPVAGLVEEALRWSSPVIHFLRHARQEVTVHGTAIRAGEPVAAWIASANWDGEVFPQPYRFDPTRRPNRHVAFGTGVHRCVGRHLARLILQHVFEALAASVDRFELAGSPVHLESNQIAGVVSLPIRTVARR